MLVLWIEEKLCFNIDYSLSGYELKTKKKKKKWTPGQRENAIILCSVLRSNYV